MKALILNALGKDPELSDIHEMVAQELDKYAIIIDSVDVATGDIALCNYCYSCWLKNPGKCVLDDSGSKLPDVMLQSDVIVIVTTIVEDDVNSFIKCAFQRTIPNLHSVYTNKTREQSAKRQVMYPSLVGIGVTSKKEEINEKQFYKAVKRIGINFRCAKTTCDLLYLEDEPSIQQGLIEETIALGVK